MYTVYKHTSPSGKVYIGITKQNPPSKRWLGGQGYRTQKKFYRAIQKYGWKNFAHEIMYQCDNADEAEQKEREYISQYNSTNNNCGYNIEKGGNYKKEIAEETRKKIKAAQNTPEYRQKILETNARRWANPEAHKRMSERFSGKNNPQYGKHMSEDRKAKSREVFAPYIEKQKKPVICIETGICYPSMAQAARETGSHPAYISGSCISYGQKKEFTKKSALHWKYA